MRLDNYLVDQGLVSTRSQAENYIKLGKVTVNNNIITKSSHNIAKNTVVKLTSPKKYVSRAGFKLESVADRFKLDFTNKAVLDVGSSTGGFSDYALQHGAAKIIAVDVGTNQMDKHLRLNPKVELHEQTDIRHINNLSTKVDYCLIDVSFISIKLVLQHLRNLVDKDSMIVAMVKPQFEAENPRDKNKGVIKNESIRRSVLKDFERYAVKYYKIIDKADSKVAGPKGNVERFYLLRLLI